MRPSLNIPSKIMFGSGSRLHLSDELKRINSKKVFFLHQGNVLENSAYLDEFKKLCTDAGVVLHISNNVEIEPALDSIYSLCSEIEDFAPDTLIAVGGGSTLDTAKVALVYEAIQKKYGKDISLEKFFPGASDLEIPERITKLILFPTTSGTGSEVTPYASVKLSSEKGDVRKKSLTTDYSYPDIAFIDPELTMSCPAFVTASSGMDALSQSIESYWSLKSTEYSRFFSREAIGLAYDGLNEIFDNFSTDSNSKEAREKLSFAANLSGIGIAHAQTTAVHAASYPISVYFGVAHGHACALTLPEFLRYNTSYLETGGKAILKALGVFTAEEAALKIEKLVDKIGLERKLSKLKITKDDLPKIVEASFRPDRAGNNPLSYTNEDLHKILLNIF